MWETDAGRSCSIRTPPMSCKCYLHSLGKRGNPDTLGAPTLHLVTCTRLTALRNKTVTLWETLAITSAYGKRTNPNIQDTVEIIQLELASVSYPHIRNGTGELKSQSNLKYKGTNK
ncbi:hypothetical protein Bpfe_009729 [Biomphalaria pfeifferi]|uniref:Uncharacterized protein n=1 Tax=Biomphalaria pfeifferi TaxID=112525 RepID=A0AAD8FDY5_BIOPF|nr:hypothetical protein Bpfe_009729 [Biomphalaria pfeifferi]